MTYTSLNDETTYTVSEAIKYVRPDDSPKLFELRGLKRSRRIKALKAQIRKALKTQPSNKYGHFI